MVRKVLYENLYLSKRFCHHHSRTFPKETDWQKVGEVCTLKFELDKLKIKTDMYGHDIYKLKTINTIQNIAITSLIIATFIR